MPAIYWVGNAQYTAQVVSGTITAVADGGTVSATINDKTITFTCGASDTMTTAATGLVALLTAQDVPPEFGEEDWTSSANVVYATANTPGTPFAGMTGGLVFSAAGGCAISQATETANSSPNDVANPLNWRTAAGVTGLPVANDDLVFQASAVSLWWNLDYFAGTPFTTITRWGSFTGDVGLLPQNPKGYLEFRPQYFTCGPLAGVSSSAGPASTLRLLLGLGAGDGPQVEAWDVGDQQTTLTVLSGQFVRFLGSHASNTHSITNATVSVAALSTESSAFASGKVDGGANLTLGVGVSYAGTLTISNGQATMFMAPSTIAASNNSTVTVRSQDTTHPVVTAEGGSSVVWISNSNITSLTLSSSATLDKSQSILPITITTSDIDGSDCQVLDPFSTITWVNATTVRGQVTTGPFTFLGPRTVKIT